MCENSELFTPNSILLKKRHKILKRRYKEAIKEREALAAARTTHSVNNGSDFVALSQTFGMEVHEFVQEQMPAADVILEEILRDHGLPSTTGTTTGSFSSGNSPLRQEVESRNQNKMGSNITFPEPTRDLEEERAGGGSYYASSVSSLSTRGVLGVTE